MNGETITTGINVKFEKSRGYRTFWFHSSDSGHLIHQAAFPRDVWRSVFPIVLKRAFAETQEVIRRAERCSQNAPVPIKACDAVVSLINFSRMIEHLDCSAARRMARAWTCVGLAERAHGLFNFDDVRAVHVQLLGRQSWPSMNFLADEVPACFREFIRALGFSQRRVKRAERSWSYAQTPLGQTYVAFEMWDRSNLVASAVISNCRVAYPGSANRCLLKQRAAIISLVDGCSELMGDRHALEAAQWEPNGHDLLELAEYLEDLRRRAGA